MAVLILERVREADLLPRRRRRAPSWPVSRPFPLHYPGGRPLGVTGPAATVRPRAAVAAGCQLTRRGLAVVVCSFLALMAVAAIVLAGAFLSVPNEPVVRTAVVSGRA